MTFKRTDVNSLRAFLWWIAGSYAFIGTGVFLDSAWFSAEAYFWLFALVPAPIVGAVMLVTAVLAAYSASCRHDGLAIVALTLYGACSLAFSWSIMTLAFEGAHGAMTGAVQWAGYAWFALLSLRRGV